MLLIPFRDSSCWRQQIQLTDSIFFLSFTWNALNEFWAMAVYDGNEALLVCGVKIVIDLPLLDQYVIPGLPFGDIVCQNVVGASDIIGRFDMSQKFQLVYYEPGEIAALRIELNAV